MKKLIAACKRVIGRRPIGGLAEDIQLTATDLVAIEAAIDSAKPIGPSSTDYEVWLKTRPELSCRFASSGKGFTQIVGYEIWRNAWLSCEFEHGIRNKPRA